MKKIIATLAIASLLLGCKTGSATLNKKNTEVKVAIDLVNVKDDKVQVSIFAPKITTDQVTFSIPKIIPGTYSNDNYGRFIDNLQAFDSKGNLLTAKKTDENNWTIDQAKKLTKITYLVNDSFDTEKGSEFGQGDVFSPAGTNIEAGSNFMVNMHGFVGYFQDLKETPYRVTITHPETLWGATSMIDLDPKNNSDEYFTSRYAELVENPVMYAKPDFTSFTVDGMDITIAVYSPTGKITAESITPEMKKMMVAQKNFLGKINSNKKYTVILYLSSMQPNDAKGFGALEHPTSTTVVMPETAPLSMLQEQMKDVVSHEFFHIVTPLTIHSKEIQYFDFNAPKMSEHLWLYEGVTEYFANLFQINQGLITEDEFYKRIAEKITQANEMNDTMPFTTMSANVLEEPYKSQYLNVYQKGALIGMCLDIIIREKSNGERGILDLMQKLSSEYGVTKPFDDKELFGKIVSLTYPEVGVFLTTYVAGPTPIPYASFLAKVGVIPSVIKTPGNVFVKGQSPYININPSTGAIFVLPGIELNAFFNTLELKGNDVILSINNQPFNKDNIFEVVTKSQEWKENDPITLTIKREGKEKIFSGKIALPYVDQESFKASETGKNNLKDAWLKG
ncbi:peptidase M61 [Flavobacterium sp. LM5]|uniref:M61 family metallopeptidase n=1 Tax=Flavobacterium sp. LM5 TaxID=1938610 RepID=UPI0009936B56|nr:peptidase M61 [Flavobacterium sp. LM5]OOV29431.1 peptidase M61 [Flavobacterium sp. LM5]